MVHSPLNPIGPTKEKKKRLVPYVGCNAKLYHYKIKICFTSIISTTVIPKQLDSRRGDGIDERYHKIKWMCVYDLMIVVSGKKKNMTLRGETYKFSPHLTSSDDDDIRKR